MIRILLADDHTIVRAGLKICIQNTMPHAYIDEAYDGNSAFEMIKEYSYDIIILDINMPDTDCIHLVNDILGLKPDSRILIFSMMSPEEMYAKKYLTLGVMGYLNKGGSTDEIMQAIENVTGNKRFVSPSLTQALAEGALSTRTHARNPFELLSPRETEIAKHLVSGESVSQIGKYLYLHTSTIGTHKARIFEKLQCKNLVELNRLATLYNFIASK